MATTCKTIESYVGDGSQTRFSYSFQLINDSDLRVAFYDDATKEYVPETGWTKPGTTSIIEFTTAPPVGQKFIIFRLTDISSMLAYFSPGHPVRAADLNDNFEQLQFAIEDVRCSGGGSGTGGGGGSGGLDPSKGFTEADVQAGNYQETPDNFAYTDALGLLFNNRVLGAGTQLPDPARNYVHPGSIALTSDEKIMMFNGTKWIQPVAAGGGSGPNPGNPTTITATAPITQTFNTANSNYDIGFDISKLNSHPQFRQRIRRNKPL